MNLPWRSVFHENVRNLLPICFLFFFFNYLWKSNFISDSDLFNFLSCVKFKDLLQRMVEPKADKNFEH